jgi:crotonobetainyl-CoA:carnitine CoA-transferase CaiB-like acyl-CoA transferase
VQVGRRFEIAYVACMETRDARGRRRARRSHAEWKREVREWKSSGLTAAAYAAKRDLAVSTLKGWAGVLKREHFSGRPSRGEKGSKERVAAQGVAMTFLPVRVARSEGHRAAGAAGVALKTDVLLKGGQRVRVGLLNVEQVAALVHALEGASRC